MGLPGVSFGPVTSPVRRYFRAQLEETASEWLDLPVWRFGEEVQDEDIQKWWLLCRPERSCGLCLGWGMQVIVTVLSWPNRGRRMIRSDFLVVHLIRVAGHTNTGEAET